MAAPRDTNDFTVEDVIVDVPDMDLSDEQIDALKKTFESTIVDSLGGPSELERLRIRIRVRVTVRVRVSVAR